ncbi:MAG: OsmC family protein [Chloroflexi bacterium]|nr:OsmC family protein [Chloroflexota bacterium]
MSTLDPYLARKATALAQRRADFTAQPEKATVRIQASSWVAGNTGARPVKLGDTLLVTDSAPALAGHGLGPTAPELLLGALASCLVHTYLIQAVLLQIPIDGVELEVQGAVPMGGVVGLPYTDPPQLQEITYRARLFTAASEPEIERMHQAVAETCPVLNTLRLPTAVTRQP